MTLPYSLPTEPADPAGPVRFAAALRAAGLLVMTIGVLGLIGWLGDVDALLTWGTATPMRPLAAMEYLLIGAATFACAEHGARCERLRMPSASVVLLISLMQLGQAAGGTDLRIGAVALQAPSDAGMLASVALILLALALLAVRRMPLASQVLGLAVLWIGLFATVSYALAFGDPAFHARLPFPSLALHCAVPLVICAIAVVLRTDRHGLMRLALAGGAAGVVVRWMLPMVLVAPIAVTAARMALLHTGVLSDPHASVATVFGATVLFLFILRSLARSFERLEVERNAALERAVRSRELLRTVIDAIPDTIVIKNEDRRFALVNEAAKTLFGWRGEEYVGRTLSTMLTGEVLLSNRHMIEIGEATDDAALAGPDPVRFTENVHDRHGKGYCFDYVKLAVPDPGGAAPLIVAVGRDNTELYGARLELAVLNEALEDRVRERTAKLEAATGELEEFTHMIAHDLRAPLRAMDAFGQLLDDEYAERLDAEGRRYIRRIRNGAATMADLIDGLLAFSNCARGELVRVPVDLSAQARAIGRALTGAYAERQVEFVVAPALIATGDPRLVKVLLEHLLDNAWRFTDGRSDVCVEVGSAATPRGHAFFVRDNGVGFAQQYADTLFRPFRRLHQAGGLSGAGVGLASVRRIVERHGGEVWAEAEEGAGATFYFTLPGLR